jgi:hypothetical protein
MSDITFWECPNCGGSDFVEITPHKHRCAYCGTVLTVHEPKAEPDTVTCPRCGSENERNARYCGNCGKTLGWTLALGKIDPAIISIIVTVVGSSFLPIGAAILGLILGYRTLRETRAGVEGNEKLAKAAVVVGWIGLAYTALPFCVVLGGIWVEIVSGIIDGLVDILSQLCVAGSGA